MINFQGYVGGVLSTVLAGKVIPFQYAPSKGKPCGISHAIIVTDRCSAVKSVLLRYMVCSERTNTSELPTM